MCFYIGFLDVANILDKPLDKCANICYYLIMDIKAIRQKLQLTQEQLASKLGVTTFTVRRWEKGKTKPSPLSRKAIENLLKETGK